MKRGVKLFGCSAHDAEAATRDINNDIAKWGKENPSFRITGAQLASSSLESTSGYRPMAAISVLVTYEYAEPQGTDPRL